MDELKRGEKAGEVLTWGKRERSRKPSKMSLYIKKEREEESICVCVCVCERTSLSLSGNYGGSSGAIPQAPVALDSDDSVRGDSEDERRQNRRHFPVNLFSISLIHFPCVFLEFSHLKTNLQF